LAYPEAAETFPEIAGFTIASKENAPG